MTISPKVLIKPGILRILEPGGETPLLSPFQRALTTIMYDLTHSSCRDHELHQGADLQISSLENSQP